MTINDSWAYLAGDNNWKSPQELLQNLVECARDGGNYLLDIGPKADGAVPDPSVSRLKTIGKWLQKNGDAVYRHGEVPFSSRKYWRVHAQGKYALYHHLFLAGRDDDRRRRRSSR